MAEALLRIDGLDAGYGDVQVLWDVSLEVPRGEIACLVGSNGAGKTTLMRAISGLIPAKKGAIAFEGTPIANATPERVLAAGLAHVPEGRRLFSAMSVRDNLLMGAYLRTDGAAAVAADLERMLELFPILRQRHRQDAGTLSGGEQQMLAIARALMSRPRLLLLDEPSLGLAPMIVKQIFQIIREINTRRKMTIFLVEQNAFHALRLAHRGYVMETGRVVAGGDAHALIEDPAVRSAYLGL